MSIFRQVCRKNWYIIASTLLLAVTSGILCGIMVYDKQYFSPDKFSVCIGMMFFDVVLLIAAFLITYFFADVLKKKYSSLITFALVIPAFIFRENELSNVIDYCTFFFIAAVLSLTFYYVNYCVESVWHTVFYITMITAMSAVMFYDVEFYIIALVNIFLFLTNHRSVNKKTVKIINLIFTVALSLFFLLTFVIRITEYSDSISVDTEIISEYEKFRAVSILEKMFATTKAFGTSEFFGEFANESFTYNLAKISGYYGYVAGIGMLILFVVFMVSFLTGYRKNKPEHGVAAIVITVSIVTAIVINFGCCTVAQSDIPFLSLLPGEYLKAGLLTGIIFASDKAQIKELKK